MRMRLYATRPRALVIAVALTTILSLSVFGVVRTRAATALGFYQQTNLVSDLPGVAAVTDSHLVNAWGMSHSSTSPWWISDNGTGVSTLYTGSGAPFPLPPATPLVVTIPPPLGSPAGTSATPTGNVFNGTSSFVVTKNGVSGPATFLFATEDGTISGWNRNVDPTNAILGADQSASGAVYKGLALGSNSSGEFLFATNFRNGTVDVFDTHFAPTSLAGSFTDPRIPSGFAPFGIANLHGQLYVTYAKQDADKHDDVAGPANGFVDLFDTNGNLIKRLVTRGRLNSPWGLTFAPTDFGQFSNDLLVGNFGDGRINVVDPSTGDFLGQLRDRENRAITIDGLWGLAFGNGATAGPTNTLFFTAGIDHEAHGLFGSLRHEARA
jgi:uncharacterized protein (TIGR03118 family)